MTEGRHDAAPAVSPFGSLGCWEPTRIRQLIDALPAAHVSLEDHWVVSFRRVLLRDGGAREVRDRLAALLEAEVAMRVSGPTVAGQARYDQMSAELDEARVRLGAIVPDGSA